MPDLILAWIEAIGESFAFLDHCCLADLRVRGIDPGVKYPNPHGAVVVLSVLVDNTMHCFKLRKPFLCPSHPASLQWSAGNVLVISEGVQHGIGNANRSFHRRGAIRF